MQYTDARSRAPIVLRRVAAVLVAALIAATATVAAAAPAAASVVPLPDGITAQMITHTGWDADIAPRPAEGDCARFGSAGEAVTTGAIGNPGGDPGTAGAAFTDGRSGVVGAGSFAYSAHGDTSATGCGGPALDLSRQSAVGFEPAAVATIDTDTTFNLGRMVHRNNPLSTLVNQWFRGTMQVTVLGLVLPYEWRLHETSNTAEPASNPINDDVLEFVGTIGEQTFIGADGARYTLVVSGFTDPLADGSCAPVLADPAGVVNRFDTVERTSTYGCLYARVERVRTLTIVKVVDVAQSGIPSFSFSSSSTAPGSAWGSAFDLTPTGVGAEGAASVSHDVVEAETITISEDTAATPWRFTSLECVDGDGRTLAIASGSTITLSGVQTEADAIVCTYTNTDTTTVEPVGSLRIVKTVTPREGTDAAAYTGGRERLFTVDYTCTLGGIEAASGSLDVSIARPGVVDGLPVDAECAVTGESLVTETGDFSDAGVDWDGFDAGAPATIVEGSPATVGVDNRFAGEASGTPGEQPGGGTATTPPPTLPLTDGSQRPPFLALTGSAPLLPLAGLGAMLLILGLGAFVIRNLRRARDAS